MYKPEIVNFTDEQYQIILDGLKRDDEGALIAFSAVQYFSYERLIETLMMPDLRVQQAAVNALGERHEVQAIDLLLERLNLANASICASIIMALVNFKDERAIEPIINLLASLEDDKWPPEEKTNLAFLIPVALGQLGGERAMNALRSLSQYGNEQERQSSSNTLNWIENAPAREKAFQKRQAEEKAEYERQVDEKQREVLKIEDTTVREATGKGWQSWHKILARYGIEQKGRDRAAKFLRDRFGQTFWWARTITIHYEQTLKHQS